MTAVNLSDVQGLLYPSCYDVLRHWTVPEERSRTGTTVLTGKLLVAVLYSQGSLFPSLTITLPLGIAALGIWDCYHITSYTQLTCRATDWSCYVTVN